MRLHLSEELYAANSIGSTLTAIELEALRVGIAVGQSFGNRTPESSHRISDLADSGPAFGDSFQTYDPLAPVLQAGSDELGNFTSIWTKRQVSGLATYAMNAARLSNDLRHSRTPGVLNPMLSTALAAAEADSRGTVTALIAEYKDWWTYDPASTTLYPGETATPGRIVSVGFTAASIALGSVIAYNSAAEIVEEFNSSPFAA